MQDIWLWRRRRSRRFSLDQIIFIPSGIPPHKQKQRLARFVDRFAMVALACANCPQFIPSLAEAGADLQGKQVIYSVDTVRAYLRKRRGEKPNLYFIVGADQFLNISKWRQSIALLGMCNFIVANRPGFQLEKLRSAIPQELLRQAEKSGVKPEADAIALKKTSRARARKRGERRFRHGNSAARTARKIHSRACATARGRIH